MDKTCYKLTSRWMFNILYFSTMINFCSIREEKQESVDIGDENDLEGSKHCISYIVQRWLTLHVNIGEKDRKIFKGSNFACQNWR